MTDRPSSKEEARKRLLRPLTDEEASAIKLVTPEQIEAVLRVMDRELRHFNRALEQHPYRMTR